MPKTHFLAANHGFVFPNQWFFDDTERQVIRNIFDAAIGSAIGLLMTSPSLSLAARTLGLSTELAGILGAAATPETYGLCGGMAFASLDYYTADWLIPQDPSNPVRDTPWRITLRDYIWTRLLYSLTTGGVAARTLMWMAVHQFVPAGIPFDGGASRLVRWSRLEFEGIKPIIDGGNPCPIALVRNIQDPFNQHQVLVTGYEDAGDGTGVLFVYDNNCPNREAVITVDFRGPVLGVTESCASNAGPDALRGFFRALYVPMVPPLEHPPVPRDGTLVQRGDAISVIYGGLDFHIPSMEVLDERSFDHEAVRQGWDGPLDLQPSIRKRPTFVQQGNDIYVLWGGARLLVPNAVFDTWVNQGIYDRAAVEPLWPGALDNIPTVPRDGTLFREASGTISVIQGGARFHVPNMGVLNRLFSTAQVLPIWNGALAAIPTIPQDGTLLREESGGIFVIYGGAKFHVPNMDVFNRFFIADRVRQVWDGALDAIPTIPQDNTLLREESGEIDVIEGGFRFHIPDMDVFNRFFIADRVRQVWNGALDTIPEQPWPPPQ